MDKIDLKKALKQLYNPSAKEVVAVEVPEMSFLMVDGSGDPNTSQAFQEAIGALYGLSYTLKFMLKKSEPPMDYSVMPLEGLWWMDDMEAFSLENKGEWRWTAAIVQPEWVTPALFQAALAEVAKKKDAKALAQVRLEHYHEGLAAQIMHIGPYSAEEPAIRKIHDFIRASGRELRGKHHEIYLSDPRRVAPEKMRTVIRQPMR